MATGIILCCLAALMPALLLFFPNMAEIPLVHMLPYFGVLFLMGIIAWAGMYLITRRKHLAALAAAIWLLVLLNIGRLVPVIHTVFPLAGLKIIAPVTLVILVGATYGLSRLSDDSLKDVVVILAIGLAAVILSSAVMSIALPQKAEDAAGLDASETAGTEETPSGVLAAADLTPAEETDRPDIYWIICDEYAGMDELSKYYHYDNTPFYNNLREMGFTASEHSYNWNSSTYRILNDILNMEYVSTSDQAATKKALADPNAPLWSMLKKLGYELYEIESASKFGLTSLLDKSVADSAPKTADGQTALGLLLQYSILYRYENQITDFILPQDSASSEKDSILSVFESVENIAQYKTKKPSFTAIYLRSPHAPYLFDRNGGLVPEANWKNRTDKKYYLDQLVFVSKHLEKMCRSILVSDPDSIIVLQSDHGQRHAANVTYLDTTNILNAVYFRGKNIDEITDRNGMNTWITVLNRQFNLNLPAVEEKRLRNEYRDDKRDPNEEDPNEGIGL